MLAKGDEKKTVALRGRCSFDVFVVFFMQVLIVAFGEGGEGGLKWIVGKRGWLLRGGLRSGHIGSGGRGMGVWLRRWGGVL